MRIQYHQILPVIPLLEIASGVYSSSIVTVPFSSNSSRLSSRTTARGTCSLVIVWMSSPTSLKFATDVAGPFVTSLNAFALAVVLVLSTALFTAVPFVDVEALEPELLADELELEPLPELSDEVLVAAELLELVEALVDSDADVLALVEVLADSDADVLALVEVLTDSDVLAETEVLVLVDADSEALTDSEVLALSLAEILSLTDALSLADTLALSERLSELLMLILSDKLMLTESDMLSDLEVLRLAAVLSEIEILCDF